MNPGFLDVASFQRDFSFYLLCPTSTVKCKYYWNFLYTNRRSESCWCMHIIFKKTQGEILIFFTCNAYWLRTTIKLKLIALIQQIFYSISGFFFIFHSVKLASSIVSSKKKFLMKGSILSLWQAGSNYYTVVPTLLFVFYYRQE